MASRSVKSANRVFQLLEVFERERRSMRVGELVEKLDMPQSSLSMLLKTLVADGYIDFDPVARAYCPSVRVAYLCQWTAHLPHRADAIPEALRALAAQTGETVLLGRLDGVRMQYVTVIDSQHDLRFAPVAGTKRPVHRTAIGIMLLTTISEETASRILRKYNAEMATQQTLADVAVTLKEVAIAREQGYYHSQGLATPGAGVLAMLLPSSIRGQRLSVGIGAPLDRLLLHKRELLALLRTAAEHC